MLGILKKKTQVILDTNFLILPGSVGTDIFSEIQRIMSEPYELCVLEDSLEELEKIVLKSSGKDGFNAKLGLIMAKQKGLKTLRGSSGGYADKAILELASKDPGRVVVATQDADLIRKLSEKGVRVIRLRQRKYLELG